MISFSAVLHPITAHGYRHFPDAMGNLCGKESSDSFAQPGRVLGTAPEQPTTASVPAKRTVGGPPRALGGGGGGGSPAAGQSSADNDARRRAAAAAEVGKNPSLTHLLPLPPPRLCLADRHRGPLPVLLHVTPLCSGPQVVLLDLSHLTYTLAWWSQERAKRNSAPAGKLGEQLKAQKAQTRADTLKEASETNRRQRDADASAATLSHN